MERVVWSVLGKYLLISDKKKITVMSFSSAFLLAASPLYLR